MRINEIVQWNIPNWAIPFLSQTHGTLLSSCYCYLIRQSATKKRPNISQTSWKPPDRKKRVACQSVISEKSNFGNEITTTSIDLMNSPWRTGISKFPWEGRRKTGGLLGSVRQFLNEKVAMHFNKISARFRRRLYTIEPLINLSVVLYPARRRD